MFVVQDLFSISVSFSTRFLNYLSIRTESQTQVLCFKAHKYNVSHYRIHNTCRRSQYLRCPDRIIRCKTRNPRRLAHSPYNPRRRRRQERSNLYTPLHLRQTRRPRPTKLLFRESHSRTSRLCDALRAHTMGHLCGLSAYQCDEE